MVCSCFWTVIAGSLGRNRLFIFFQTTSKLPWILMGKLLKNMRALPSKGSTNLLNFVSSSHWYLWAKCNKVTSYTLHGILPSYLDSFGSWTGTCWFLWVNGWPLLFTLLWSLWEYLQSYHLYSFDDKAVYLLDWNIPLNYSDHGLDTPFVQ